MFRSIRVKLTLWYIAAFSLVFAAFAFAAYSLFVRVLQDEARTNISELSNNFVTAAKQARRSAAHNTSPDGAVIQTLDDFQFRDYHFAVYTEGGALVGKTIEEDLPDGTLIAAGPNAYTRIDLSGRPYDVKASSFNLDRVHFKLLVLYSLSEQQSIEDRIQRIFLIVAPILLLLAGIGGYVLAREGLKPLAVMGERAKNISAANLHERLPVANPNDEIGNLAVLFNQLLDRLDREFDRQRRFMSDASHELRTPLAIVQGESEVALQKEERSVQEYRDSLRIVNEEGRRLAKIVEDLFVLARADSGSVNLNFQEVDVNEIVEDCVTSIRTLAHRRGITLRFVGEELRLRADELLLRRLFINLLDNAVKYNFNGGSVDVTVSGHTVEVRNTGPEIPVEQQDLIFERFYRVEKNFSPLSETVTSGAGLGLSIASWIAAMHRAEIFVTRSEAGENIFSVNFQR